MFKFLYFAFTFIVFIFDVSGQDPRVETRQGTLEGTTIELKSGKIIEAFIGVRYAEPPIGNLRFKAPVPVKSWSGVREAKIPHAICPQRDTFRRDKDISGDEDCLFLNVYTSLSPSNTPNPVMVFFHGGGFLAGAGHPAFYGPDILMEKNITLVIPNYRLGALGFLSMGDKVLPGNYGLKDQNMVLRWIQENIAAFNGDPKSVTIFGNSAGGASVTLQMMSKKSKGLFHRAISESGTLHCPWAFAPGDQHIRFAKQLGELFNCDTESSTKLAECLRKQSAHDIVSKDVHFDKWDKDPMMPFKPVVEDPNNPDAFITIDPYTEECKFASEVPWIIGITRDEGALRVPWLYTEKDRFQEFAKDFDKLAPLTLYYDEIVDDVEKATQKISKFYFDNKDITKNRKQELIDMFSDGWFNHGIAKTVSCVRRTKNIPVYFYLLDYKGSSSFSKIFGDKSKTGEYGVSHADELQYLFPIHKGLWPELPPTKKDQEISDLFTSVWVNFAKSGKPIIGNDATIWQPVQSDDIEYLNIGQDKVEMKSHLYKDRLKLWQDIYGKYTKDEL